MNQDPIQQLKKLKLIAPDPAFLVESKRRIFASRPAAPPFLKVPVWFFAGVGAIAIFALGLTISFTVLSPKPVLSAALDPENINEEFADLINIQLQEIKYEQSIAQTINSAIDEISDTGTRHLNPAVIEQEKTDLIEDNLSSEIDELLETIVQ